MNKAQEIAEFILQDFEKNKNQKQFFLFECKRYHPVFKYSRADNNAFCTAYILHRLKKNSSILTDIQKTKLLDALNLFHQKIPEYKHVLKRDPSYNFYQNHPKSNFFPNSKVIGKFKHFKLADEIDTSALVLQVLGNKSEMNKLFDLANSFANQHPCPPKAELAKHKVYGTWFGNKTNFEIDLCALCNFLELKISNSDSLSNTDQSSLLFLRESIINKWWMEYSYFLSPSYQRPIIVGYHLARFINMFPQHFSENHFETLKKDISTLNSNTDYENRLKIFSLNRLTRKAPELSLKHKHTSLSVRELNFPWFRAAFLSVFKTKTIHKLGKSELFQMHFYCPSLLKAIELEEMNHHYK